MALFGGRDCKAFTVMLQGREAILVPRQEGAVHLDKDALRETIDCLVNAYNRTFATDCDVCLDVRKRENDGGGLTDEEERAYELHLLRYHAAEELI